MNFFFSDCETETIYTSQSRDTVSTEDEDDDDDGNEFDDDMVVEYEPTSGAETEERPPQVTTRHTQLQYTYKGWTHKYNSFSVLNLIIFLHEICKDW